MKSIINRLQTSAATAALCCAALSPLAFGQPLDIADAPLFITNNVPPNIVLAVDDSGSMDSEVIFETNDGALWWNTSRRSFVEVRGGQTLPLINPDGSANGTWKKYVYLFPNGTGNGNRVYSDQNNDHYAIPPLPEFAYARSPDYNKAYFAPFKYNENTGAVEIIIYRPWVDPATGGRMPNANPSAAKSDPIDGNFTFDLTSTTCSDADNRTFRMFEGMTLPEGSLTRNNCRELNNATNITSVTNQRIGYFPATFYLRDRLPASFGYIATPLSGRGPGGETLFGYEIKPGNFSGGAAGAAYTSLLQNFANWFQYYRKRHLAVRGGIVESFDGVDNARVGSCTINNRNNLSMLDLAVPAQRRSFYNNIYSYGGNSGGTPNRQAVEHLGDQVATNADIIQQPCQQNFAVLFTDGYATLYTGAGVNNADGDNGAPFADNESNTMADIGMYYYETLHTLGRAAGFAKGQVATASGCPSPRLDCNSNPHLVTFGVTLGQRGNIFGVNADATADPFASNPDWSTARLGERGPGQIDDLWHATINSRGRMLNANTPIEVAAQFSAALQEIAARAGSSSSLSINTGTIASDSRLFQASFQSGNWAGELVSRPISDGTGNSTCSTYNASNGSGDEIGAVCSPEWSAAEQLDAQNWDSGREIITRFNGQARAFRRSAFPQNVQNSYPASVFSYLRGDRSLEEANIGPNAPDSYRNRDTVLGDIVNSSPVFVGAPDRIRYPVNWNDLLAAGDENTAEDQASLPYRAPAANNDFLRQYANRTPVVYVGANDGMLHGFDADSGAERIAYIPEAVIGNLPQLLEKDYDHSYFVDGSPIVGDAIINRNGSPQWRSILVSGLRAGGSSVFALDVTEPANFSEDSAADTVLWEFTDNADLGLTFSEPAIVRLHNGGWAAIFGNGYNSANQSAVFYVVDLTTGNLLAKLDTGATPNNGNPATANGLGSVFPIDLDGDFITDYVYAGDLYGNLWKFDLTAASPDQWKIGFGTDAAPEPLFTARDSNGNRQTITTQPQVGAHPFGLNQGVMVYFGTGKYIENGDKTPATNQRHSFYGIWDVNVFTALDPADASDSTPFATTVRNGFGRSRLTAQSVLNTVASNGETFRVLSNNTVQYQQSGDGDSATTGGANKRGWVLDLPVGSGEMVVSDATLRGKVVAFSTLIPSDIPCRVGGTGFFMVVDAASGGRTSFSALDVNGDRQFKDNDVVSSAGANVNPSGLQITAGAPGRAGFAIARSLGIDVAQLPISNATIKTIDVNVGLFPEGRRTWRELRR